MRLSVGPFHEPGPAMKPIHPASASLAQATSGLSDNTKAALLMMASQLSFVINDTLVKLASDQLGLFQIVTLRGVPVIAAFVGWMRLQGMSARSQWPLPKLVVLRVGAELIATVCFLLALVNMNIGDLAAISQFVPLGITVAAAVIFGERVRWPRYVAVIGGLIGVLLVIRPGTTQFSPYTLFALGAVAAVICRDLLTRRLPSSVSSVTVAFATAVATWLLGVSAVAGGAQWRPISLAALGLVGLAAVAVVGGLTLSVMTIRVGELSFAAPFRYTAVLWGMLSQVFVFGVIPDAMSLLGAGCIVAMGLFSMYRDRQRGSASASATGLGSAR